MKHVLVWFVQGRPPRESVVFAEDLPKLDILRGKCTTDEYNERLGRGTAVIEAECAMHIIFSLFGREDYL